MNAANLLRVLVILSLLSLGDRIAGGEGSIDGVSRVPPVGEVQQVELRLYAVEMPGQTLRQLGLWTESKQDPSWPFGKPVEDSLLLKDAAAWEAALETAVRLGAAHVVSAPTLVTVNGREAELESLGVDFSEKAGTTPGATNISIKWNVKPMLIAGDKVRIDYHFSRSKTDPTREVATPAGMRPAVRLQQVHTGVEVPLSKPTVLGRLMRFESIASRDAKKGRGSKKTTDEPQETTTLLVVTANVINAKLPAQPKDERR